VLDVTGTDVSVVALQRCNKVSQRELVSGQAFWIGRNLILLGKPANGIDFGDPRNIAQLRLDDPVLNHPQVGRRIGTAVLLDSPLFSLDRPQENLTKTG